MDHSDIKFPARMLFTIVAEGMGDHCVSFSGPSGTRSVSACTGGHFAGPRLQGAVVAEHSNDWLLSSPADPALGLIEGLITLSSDDGDTVLVTYRGRRSGRYGPLSGRVGMVFDAGTGSLDWLNDRHAAGYVDTVGRE